jgi:hypothetical protein
MSLRTAIIVLAELLEIIWLEACAPVGINATMQNYKRGRTYGNNTQRGFSKEQEKGGGKTIGLQGTKNKDSSGETKKIYTGEVERLVRLED